MLVVESPAKCKVIEGYLEGYKCIATCGHFRELRDLKSIKNFEPKYELSEKKGFKEFEKKIKAQIKKKEPIILATDNDREGEAIAWHICDYFKLPLDTPRIIFNEITEECVQRAIHNPTIINMDIVYAQQTRQMLDMLLGYTISPLLWKHISHNAEKSLSAGRCQTPALRIIYDAHKEKKPPQIHYIVKGYFTSQNIVFQTRMDSPEQTQRFLESCPSSFNYTKSYVQVKYKPPPKPYTTATLLQAFPISSKEIMAICCKLYEKGLITYPRTNSTFYAREFLVNTRRLIEKDYGSQYVSPNLFNLTQTTHPHEAIRPTNMQIEKVRLAPNESRIYERIWKNAMESCMGDAVIQSFQGTIFAPMDVKLICESEIVVFQGWQILAPKKDNKEYHFLRNIPDNTILTCKKMSADFFSDSSNYYSEASLIHALEVMGIGKPSTFANIVDKIQERKYVSRQDIEGGDFELPVFEIDGVLTSKLVKKTFGEKNKLQITHTGIMVIEFLIKHFDKLFDYHYTKQMEEILETPHNSQKICEGYNLDIQRFVSSLKEKKKTKEEINIDEESKLIIGTNGSVIVTEIEGEKKYTRVKQDIDLEKLKAGEYKMEEIVDKSNTSFKGSFGGEEIIIKSGRYGIYTTWRGKNVSLHAFKKTPIEKITLENVIWAIKQNAQKFNFDFNF